MISINKLLILRCLLDGKQLPLSKVNGIVNFTLGKERPYSYLRNDIRDLHSKNLISYIKSSALERDNKKYIKITEAGKIHYKKLENEFLKDFRIREKIKEDIKRDIQ